MRAACSLGFTDKGPVFEAGFVLDIDLDLDGAQRGTVLQDLHSVGAGVGAVVLVDPLPGDIVIGDSSLARAVGIGGGVDGDTVLDSSHGVGLGGVHVHQIQAVALGSVVGGRSGNHDLGGAQFLAIVGHLHGIVTGGIAVEGIDPLPSQNAVVHLGTGNIGARFAHGFIDIAVDAALDQSHSLVSSHAGGGVVGQVTGDLAVGAVGAADGHIAGFISNEQADILRSFFTTTSP